MTIKWTYFLFCNFSDVDRQVCTNVTLALDYKFYWKGNGITNITLKRTVGAVALKDSGK